VGLTGQSNDVVVCGVALPFIMTPTSPYNMHRHTPDMVHCPVLPGMRVTVETPVLKSPMDRVTLTGPIRQMVYARDRMRWCTVVLIGTSRRPFGMPHPWSGRGLVVTRLVVADVGQ
jgi:hypothetical protein